MRGFDEILYAPTSVERLLTSAASARRRQQNVCRISGTSTMKAHQHDWSSRGDRAQVAKARNVLTKRDLWSRLFCKGQHAIQFVESAGHDVDIEMLPNALECSGADCRPNLRILDHVTNSLGEWLDLVWLH